MINPIDSPTTDGIDPESCHDADIAGVRISVGDDCIAIKSGKLDFARKFHTPASHITIHSCLMEYGRGGVAGKRKQRRHSGCAGDELHLPADGQVTQD